MAGTIRSWKNIWALVSEKSVLKSSNLIGTELQDNANHLLNGILHYKKANSASLTEAKNVVPDFQYEFITKLSKLLELDAIQCFDLFKSYLQFEYKGIQNNLKILLSNERHEQFLLLQIWNHYFSERLYCMLTMKHILEHWHDADDEHQALYQDFLECIDLDRIVVKKIINQLEALQAVEIPNKDSCGQLMTDALTCQWVTIILKEQSELLQLILLYYKYVEPTVDEVQQIFSFCQKHGFGLRQPFRQFLNDGNMSLVHSVRYLEAFVAITSLRLDLFCQLQENDSEQEHFLLKSEETLKNLSATIEDLGNSESHGPVLLAWMAFSQASNSPFLLANSHKCGNGALRLNVFNYLLEILHQASVGQNGSISAIIHMVVYNIFYVLLCHFELHTMGSLETLFAITKQLLKFPDIADDFWDKGTEDGLGLLLTLSVDKFPLDFLKLITLCSSLAKAGNSSSQKVMAFMRNLPVVSELMENIDIADISAMQEPSMFRLLRNRMLYSDCNLVIPSNTVGIVMNTDSGKSQTMMQWQIPTNGWQICLCELHVKLQEISVCMGTMEEESLLKTIEIADLVHSLLKSDLSSREPLRHIINMLFSILHRLAMHPSPPLDLLSKCLDIATLLFYGNPDVWMCLIQMNLLPSMSGIPQDISELTSGVCLSMGVLCGLIASKECVIGKYPLCTSFLNLLVVVSKNVPTEGSNSFLICVLYILREVFSSFHKWRYIDQKEKILIGQNCLNLFHNLFSLEEGERSKLLNKVEELCVYSLLYCEAGQTLLRIVCTGEEIIQHTVTKISSYCGEQLVILIRLSLSVLNRLLLLRHRVTTPHQHSSGESPFEKVLFSIPGHTEQPQVVLTVANYAFQHYNPRLATLAVQLLKRFAKEFPMSLLACFGSTAESIRDHFLSSLSSPYGDVRLKVSILEFLTVCIAQQPGLIEMFINISTRGKEQEKKDSNEQSCLTSVKNLLEEKLQRKNDYLQDLQCVAVEFIHAVWAGHQGLAMEALKKDSQFWKLLCSSLLSDDISIMHPKIVAHVVRTLALELFYTYSTTVPSTVPDDGAKAIIREICSGKYVEKCSKYVHSTSPKGDFGRLDILDRSTISEEKTENFPLYKAWKDFLLVLAKCETNMNVVMPATSKKVVLNHILENLLNQITGDNTRLIIILSELYLMLFSHWKNDCASGFQDILVRIRELIEYLSLNADTINPCAQLAIITIAIHFINAFKSETEKPFDDWLLPICVLLKKTCPLIDLAFKKQEDAVLKLPIAVISLLNKLVNETADSLPILKSQVTLPLLVSLLTKCLKLQFGFDLALSIVTLFVSVASTLKASEALCNTGFMAEITLVLSVMDLNSTSGTTTLSSGKKVTASTVYFSFLGLLRTLLQSLGNYFLQDALNFVGVHLDVFHSAFNLMKHNPLSSNLHDIFVMCSFLHQLSFHQETWRLKHPKSFEVLLDDISFCTNTVISVLTRPNMLKQFVEQKEPKKSTTNLNKNNETKSLRVSTSDDDTMSCEKIIPVQTQLYNILAVCLAMLKQYSPGLHEAISNPHMDPSQFQLFLDLTFQTSSLDQICPASFGAILASINMCLRWLIKHDRTPSPGKTPDSSAQIEKPLLLYVLEVSLALLVSQCSLALSHPQLTKMQKQLIRRELASELNILMQSASRYFRKGPLSPSPSLPHAQQKTPPHSAELPFMKLIDSLMKRIVI